MWVPDSAFRGEKKPPEELSSSRRAIGYPKSYCAHEFMHLNSYRVPEELSSSEKLSRTRKAIGTQRATVHPQSYRALDLAIVHPKSYRAPEKLSGTRRAIVHPKSYRAPEELFVHLKSYRVPDHRRGYFGSFVRSFVLWGMQLTSANSLMFTRVLLFLCFFLILLAFSSQFAMAGYNKFNSC